jgi:hypothetical protein
MGAVGPGGSSRVLLGDCTSERLELRPGFRRALSQKALARICRRAMPMPHSDAGRVLSVDLESPDVARRTSKAQVGAGRRRSGPHARIVAEQSLAVRRAEDECNRPRRARLSACGGPCRQDRCGCSTPEAATATGLPLRAQRGSLIETAPWATKQKRWCLGARKWEPNCSRRLTLPLRGEGIGVGGWEHRVHQIRCRWGASARSGHLWRRSLVLAVDGLHNAHRVLIVEVEGSRAAGVDRGHHAGHIATAVGHGTMLSQVQIGVGLLL